MPRLDLKFIAHHGSVVRHRVAGREELVGSDVIVAHRMLKNHVVERLGIPAYAMFSAACIAAMGIDPIALGMTRYQDAFDDLGEMSNDVHDLGAAWAREQQLRRTIVTDKDAGYVFEVIHPAPRDIVWSFMTDPVLRPRWQADVTSVDQLPSAPRRGVGTTNHCMHGKDVLVEEILDWRPTDYVTHRSTVPSGFQAVSTFAFEDVPDGTRVRVLFTWGKTRREREEDGGPAREFLSGLITRGHAALHDVLVAEMARRAVASATEPPEPVAPASLDREIREPVRS